MKAVVFRGVGDIRLEDVDTPELQDPEDVIVRITATAICGTDLHLVRGTFPGMKPGTIIGHEGVGVVHHLGSGVRNLNIGDRVVIPSTIACGVCPWCRNGEYAQCDRANPNGPQAGTCFFGGPESSGPVHGLQAELARIPYGNVGLVKLPDEISDEDALPLSDVFPTGWFATELAGIAPGNTVAVFGAGPVGQMVIASAQLRRAGRIFAVDTIESRLHAAREQGAEAIDFDVEDPIETIRELTAGMGVDCAIDAVGVDANHPRRGPAAARSKDEQPKFDSELHEIAPVTSASWRPGDAPSQALEWAIAVTRKSGTVAIVGVYPEVDRFFPIGAAMNKNLTLRMGNCNHRRYIPELLELVRSGVVDPTRILTRHAPFYSAIEAYHAFDQRQPGWLKVMLDTSHLSA